MVADKYTIQAETLMKAAIEDYSEIINDWIDSIIDFFINHKSNVIKWFINSMNNHIID